MNKKTPLRVVYYVVWSLIILMSAFWLYLNLIDNEVRFAQAEAISTIEHDTADTDSIEFVVVGDVKSSVRTFADEILPQINASSAQFVVSAGNAVAGGSEESYRQAYEVFQELRLPYVLSFGENEATAFGSMRYYDKLGPHFFSLQAGPSQLIFLDLTGTTGMQWQLRWLDQLLSQSESRFHFVFTGLPVHRVVEKGDDDHAEHYAEHSIDAQSLSTLRQLFREHQVDAVFSANLPLYRDFTDEGVRYVTTGGAGGLILDQEDSYHHYVRVRSGPQGLDIEPVEVNVVEASWQRSLGSAWSALLTFLYVSYIRFLLILALLIAIGVKLYQLIFVERNYYPDFTLDTSPYLNQRKRVLMLTNNYFPFVSGVTVSIQRLVNGLRKQGHAISIMAPQYAQKSSHDHDVTRVRTLFAFGKNADFRYANILSRSARAAARRFKPDLIHVHHPFGLGRLGLWVGKRLKVPVVYTYHTRLEMYAHYVPLPSRLFRNLISHQLVKHFCNRCDGVVVPTWSVEEYLRMIGVKTRIMVQPTGIDSKACESLADDKVKALRTRYQLPTAARVLVSVSRLGAEKNLEFLLLAFAELVKQCDEPVYLLLVGSGPQQAELEALAAEYAIESHVIFCGAVPPEEVALHYRLADLFVFASKSETQGMVILEAMSCALPVVAVRASGIDDVVINGKTGYKVPERVDRWVGAATMLLTDPEHYSACAAAARDYAAGYDIRIFAENINQFYAEVMAARAADEHKN
ncbi:glycosyl transferase family 1 [Aliidiomarina soli]|uniref:Glycosyl transferase family 1 n=2 Tax=Aliidiomarina soli TaxID=1928574 RepID=A0A432WEZ9_9GAMM|nr:glycosyl transferase family 1 [Aliidiomarina soli]